MNDNLKSFQIEWEAATEPCSVWRNGLEQAFRRFGKAKAWLEFADETNIVSISKIEVEGADRRQGEGGRCLELLKRLADKHRVFLFASVVPYDPDPHPTKQREAALKFSRWYAKNGFAVVEKHGIGFKAWYPNERVGEVIP